MFGNTSHIVSKILCTLSISEWLVAHNVRREEWHESHNETYVPLKWSSALKDESKDFADTLSINGCGSLYHGEITTSILLRYICLAFLRADYLTLDFLL